MGFGFKVWGPAGDGNRLWSQGPGMYMYMQHMYVSVGVLYTSSYLEMRCEDLELWTYDWPWTKVIVYS